jgi:ATP-dependent Clp protease ATP-binding subunit ClpA
MQRIIQEKVGNVLAKAILSGRIKRGMRIEIDSQNFEIKI